MKTVQIKRNLGNIKCGGHIPNLQHCKSTELQQNNFLLSFNLTTITHVKVYTGL